MDIEKYKRIIEEGYGEPEQTASNKLFLLTS